MFITALAYLVLEGWAQWRFSRNSSYMPMGIRSNIAMNSLEAFRLKPHYHGVSRSGLLYTTNEFGFRINPEGVKNQAQGKAILLGGDSRIFGYALPYQDTIAALLEQNGYGLQQQAFPGSSPAMFNVQMFAEGVVDRLSVKPQILIYGYDREDLWNDQIFRKELQEKKDGFSLRWLKIQLGGYFWGMCVQKVRSFSSRTKTWPTWLELDNSKKNKKEAVPTPSHETLLKPTASTAGRHLPVSRAEILLMKAQSQSRGMKFVLLYLPRFLELLCDDGSMRDNVKIFCEAEQLEWIDGYELLMHRAQGDKNVIATLFLDPHEGIHYSKKANLWIVEEISRRCEKLGTQAGEP